MVKPKSKNTSKNVAKSSDIYWLKQKTNMTMSVSSLSFSKNKMEGKKRIPAE